jgi:hypothetical protein
MKQRRTRFERYTSTVVEVTTSWGTVRHLSVERIDGADGIPWDDLQAIKNDRLGEDTCAIEFYPAEREVVNEMNRRHLWEAPASMAPPLSR